MKLRLAINGFGRIGRSFVKAALKTWILYNLLPSIGLMLQQKRGKTLINKTDLAVSSRI
jgi:hypothetical protein